MTDPELIRADAADGVSVAISVSDSADLARLGLTKRHCDLAVAEVARAVFVAGGTITYGGRLDPSGFTQVLMDEIQRYADGRRALTVCLPETEHRKFTNEELASVDRGLGTSASLVCLDGEGNSSEVRSRSLGKPPAEAATALSAMRRHITAVTDARVLVGGRLAGFQGAMPGVVEEALLSLRDKKPLYVAGGFGGAALAVARALGWDDGRWIPPGLPEGADALVETLGEVRRLGEARPVSLGLTEEERRQLCATHRPGDIASLVVLGVSRLSGRS